MHPALKKGPLFTNNAPIFHFFTKHPPFHFLPTGLSVFAVLTTKNCSAPTWQLHATTTRRTSNGAVVGK